MSELDNSNMIHRLPLQDKECILIGTAHVPDESAQQVADVIAGEQPDTVCVELCESRFQSIRQKDRWQNMDIIKVVKEKKAFLLLSNLILASKIARVKAKTVVFLIDACYSSGMVNMSTAVHGLERDLRTAKDYVIITSSQANQVSLESPQLKHGVFTHFLVKGLSGEADRNGDGNVNIDELWDYINLRISQYAMNMGKEQDPGRVFSTGRSIFISKNPNY